MSDARRRHPDPRRGHPQAQPPEPLWGRGQDAIDLREAVEFRRSLDAQASADLIPMAGPDAAADQGPAIKAVWEPMAPEAPASPRRRAQDSRTHSRRAPRRGPGKRRTLIFGSAAAVVLVGAAVADLNDGNPTPVKGASTTVLPMVSDSSSPAEQSRGGELGQPTDASSPRASRSPSHSPSPSHTADHSSGPPSPSPTAGGQTSSPPAPSPTPTPGKSSPNCFLIFCG